MSVTVKVEGVDKILANLQKWQFIKVEAIKIALKETGFKVEAAAKEMCPVDTGRLRASISTNYTGSSMGRGKISSPAVAEDGVGRPEDSGDFAVVVGTNVKYAPMQEHGTKNMAAHLYLYPALFMYQNEPIRRIQKIMGKDENL
jgi:HK97 gp10 family phage protein